jgi:DNA replication protein DnaC
MEPHHPTVKVMALWGARFARRCVLREKPFPWVVLAGKSGCGKSRVAKRAHRIIRENAIDAFKCGIWARPPVSVFADWPKLAEMQDPDDYEEAAQDLVEADVVFLDDIGSESDRFKSGEHTSRLRRLLGKLEGRAVMMTTNLRPAEWAEKWDGRVESRLLAGKRLDCFEIPDYRPIIGARPG